MSTIPSVRAQIAAHLLATAGLVRESSEPIEMIRSESHSPVHMELAVGSESEGFTARNGQSRTRITVLVPYQLQAKNRISGATGYDALLTVERAILAALQVSSWGALNPRVASLCEFDSRREPGIDGWIWIVVSCLALHATLT